MYKTMQAMSMFILFIILGLGGFLIWFFRKKIFLKYADDDNECDYINKCPRPPHHSHTTPARTSN
jgi:hypothetical protein